jgi:trehalose 6-phosphate phosphatase
MLAAVRRQIAAGRRVWLFLDYDGTLVPIARTPDEARPDASLLRLLSGLAEMPALLVTVLSGRPLSSLQTMLPIPHLILAGTYGVEVQMPGKDVIMRADPVRLRPTIEQVQSAWAQLIAGRDGFLLEDKRLAVALHARFAGSADAEDVLPRARAVATQFVRPHRFRILQGDRFLEVAPAAAHKGQTVEWLLDQCPSPGVLTVYCGDDDKDEEAFAVIRRHGGISIVVGPGQRRTQAAYRFDSPDAVRGWLQLLEEVVGGIS